MGVSKTYFEINPLSYLILFIIFRIQPKSTPYEEAFFVPVCFDIMELLRQQPC